MSDVIFMKDKSEDLILSQTSFPQLLNAAEGIQKSCRDYYVSSVSNRTMRFNDNTNTLLVVPDGQQFPIEFNLTRFSFGQLCAKLGVPNKYIQNCFSTGRGVLAADNINSWISDYGKNMFIRTYNSSIRGVLTSRYSVLDTPDIVDVMADTFNSGKYSIKGYVMNPERFHARIVLNQRIMVGGEELYVGVTVDSSDVGRSVLVVQFFIYRKVCKNGMCVSVGDASLFRQVHVGISSNEFRQGISTALQRVPSITGIIITTIQKAMGDKSFDFRNLNDEGQKKFDLMLKNTVSLLDYDIEGVRKLMNEQYGFSRWGLINAVTELAQNKSLERRLELERNAGKILMAV